MAEENTQNTQDSFDEFVARHQAAQRDEDVRRDQDAQWASADKRQNGLATWALSLGIVAALMGMSLVLTAFAWIPALIGLVLGIMAVVKARKITGDGRRMGMSVAGLTLSALVLVFIAVLFVVAGTVVSQNPELLDCAQLPAGAEWDACLRNL